MTTLAPTLSQKLATILFSPEAALAIVAVATLNVTPAPIAPRIEETAYVSYTLTPPAIRETQPGVTAAYLGS